MAEPGTSSQISGEGEAVILVKAAPNIGDAHGETVCCAGIDAYGNWIRLYPVSFRVLDEAQKFKRWDRVRFRWRRPPNDHRPESRRIDSQSLAIVGRLKDSEKQNFLAARIVAGLNAERAAGRSLALLKPQIEEFVIRQRSAEEVRQEQARIDAFHAQADMFVPKPAVPATACPFAFVYRYRTSDGEREGTCQDWETEATFFHWRQRYGEADALARMRQAFGVDLPARGLFFAMGTHSRYPDTWLINGLIQLQEPAQQPLF